MLKRKVAAIKGLATKTLCLVLILVMFSLCAVGSSSSSGSSSSKPKYTCGYCGKTMSGGYYDYFNGKYACRDCSKKYRRS